MAFCVNNHNYHTIRNAMVQDAKDRTLLGVMQGPTEEICRLQQVSSRLLFVRICADCCLC